MLQRKLIEVNIFSYKILTIFSTQVLQTQWFNCVSDARFIVETTIALRVIRWFKQIS